MNGWISDNLTTGIYLYFNSDSLADLLAQGYEVITDGLDDPSISALMTNLLNQDTQFDPGDQSDFNKHH